ncbi:MAG: aminotransferase class I/II-fold pyridoxal phosphate-dependent enzyme [Mariprofundales bacterium]
MTINPPLPDRFPHGGGLEQAARHWGCDTRDILDLSTGLHPAGAPDWLGDWLRDHADLAAHYPDQRGEPARSALAEAFGVTADSLLITAGAQATIETIFPAMGWHTMAIQTPCYNEPIRCALRSGCKVRSFANGTIPPAADVLWLTSPDNPTGALHPLPSPMRNCVVDESYLPFNQRRALGVIPQLIRIGSLTKTFCIPGLRLGYVVTEASLINILRQFSPPWPAATCTLHLLPKLLPEADHRDRQIVHDRQRLQTLLLGYGWEVRPSEASFLLARPNQKTPDFAAHRILIRAFPEWPQLAKWLRFGLPGTECAWQRLEQALDSTK